MTIQSILLFLTLLVFPQKDCQNIIIDNQKFQSQSTKSYNLVGFGEIPIDKSYNYSNDDKTPFVIDNNCLSFKITHGGCDCIFEMFWDGKFRIDEKNKTIVDLKFILSWKNPCKRLNHTNLKYDLTEILKHSKTGQLYMNFVGYDKLIRIK